MSKMRKVKRSLISALLLWLGRRMLGRVQKRTIRSVTRKPKPAAVPRRLPGALRRTPRPVAAPARSFPWGRAMKGLAIGAMSTIAVAALKSGVDHVIESEREQHVVTPDFDVFADDDE